MSGRYENSQHNIENKDKKQVEKKRNNYCCVLRS